MEEFRVLVCGGRNFFDFSFVSFVMDELHKSQPISCVIHGGALGADSLAGRWAQMNHIREWIFKADWEKYKRAAGPIRNQQMLVCAKPMLVVAFSGGAGTADMIHRASKAKIEIFRAE